MHLVHGTSEDEKGQIIGYWVSKMMGKPIFPPYTAMGWLDGRDSLVASAVFNHFNGANIDVTIYGPGHLCRQTLREGFRYVFGQLKCTRLTAVCKRDNVKMRKLFDRLGFQHETTMLKYFGPKRADDGLLFRILPEQAEKWMS